MFLPSFLLLGVCFIRFCGFFNFISFSLLLFDFVYRFLSLLLFVVVFLLVFFACLFVCFCRCCCCCFFGGLFVCFCYYCFEGRLFTPLKRPHPAVSAESACPEAHPSHAWGEGVGGDGKEEGWTNRIGLGFPAPLRTVLIPVQS